MHAYDDECVAPPGLYDRCGLFMLMDEERRLGVRGGAVAYVGGSGRRPGVTYIYISFKL